MPFERSVFINCPFDEQYKPILVAIQFCCIELGFQPRIASERMDAMDLRLERITQLVQACKFSIHDLSRNKARRAGEVFRLNMPFELGIDYGCRIYGGNRLADKRILVLDEKRYAYQRALSDIAGCDPQTHDNDFEKAVRAVRNWLVTEAGAETRSPTSILNAYQDFQEWNWERLLANDFSEEDIRERPAAELISEMQNWVELGRPPSFN